MKDIKTNIAALNNIFAHTENTLTARGAFTETATRPYEAINLSSEFSRLIKAAFVCKSYASDLMMDYNMVMNYIAKGKDITEPESKTFFFAFRENGVDHDWFMASRMDDILRKYNEDHNLDELLEGTGKLYYSIWRMDVSLFEDEIITTTSKVFGRKKADTKKPAGNQLPVDQIA